MVVTVTPKKIHDTYKLFYCLRDNKHKHINNKDIHKKIMYRRLNDKNILINVQVLPNDIKQLIYMYAHKCLPVELSKDIKNYTKKIKSISFIPLQTFWCNHRPPFYDPIFSIPCTALQYNSRRINIEFKNTDE